MKLNISACIIFLVLIIGCDELKGISSGKLSSDKNHDTGDLIPLNLKDTLYYDAAMFARDTVTADGWKIKYFVKNDTTRYTDIYIQWEKDGIKRISNCGNVLEMRSYFIPTFFKDNPTHIFFLHGCATDCAAVLALPKNDRDAVEDFNFILDYNINKGQIVYINKESFSSDTLSINATDLKKRVTKSILFKNRCSMIMGNSCIDNVIFKHNRITIEGSFSDKYGNDVKETHTIKF